MMFSYEKILSSKLEDNVFSFRARTNRIFVVTLSDLHVGIGDRDYINNIVKFILSVPNMYVVLGGDAINNTTKTSKGNTLEEYASGQEQIWLLVEYMKPLVDAGRIIAVVGGGDVHIMTALFLFHKWLQHF